MFSIVILYLDIWSHASTWWKTFWGTLISVLDGLQPSAKKIHFRHSLHRVGQKIVRTQTSTTSSALGLNLKKKDWSNYVQKGVSCYTNATNTVVHSIYELCKSQSFILTANTLNVLFWHHQTTAMSAPLSQTHELFNQCCPMTE